MTDDTPHTTDASLSECGHERFERNHYFHGKLMTARDMAAEQAYHVGQRRAHARSVSGSGVAWGLDATVAFDGPEEEAVVVTVPKGYAIDGCGRPVVVPEEREVTVTDTDVLGADAATVWLEFRNCLRESVPIEGAESACEDECAYNRVLEVYDVRVEPGYPPNVTEADPDELIKPVGTVDFPGKADLPTADEGQPDPDDPGLSTIAETFEEPAGEAAGTGEDARIYLGTYTPGANRDWDRDEAQPRPHVYSNDMLYAAIARHAADFENPHQDSLIARPKESAGGGSSTTVVDLNPGETYAQGQRIGIDAPALLEVAADLGLDWDDTLQLRRVRLDDDEPIGPLASEVPVDDQGRAQIDTGHLDGAYVLTFVGERGIVIDAGDFQAIVTDPDAIREVAFRVDPSLEPTSTAASSSAPATGARLRVEHDRSDGGAVDLASDDGSVSIATSARGDDAHSAIDLSVESYVGRVIEERIDPLKRHAMEQAMKYTALVFEGVGSEFGDQAAEVAEEIARLARGAADGRLDDGTSAEAAEERDVLHPDWSVDRTLSGDVFAQVVADLADLESQFLEAVSGSVSEDSRRRLAVAVERLQSAEGPDADTLGLARVQDDVVDAVEWLEPVETDGGATFASTTYEAVRGDVAEITVNLQGTEDARLVVGSEDVNYVSHVDLVDGSGDGTVSVLMNTYVAGRSAEEEANAFGTRHDDDGVTASLDVGPIDGPPLDAGDYALRLEVDGEETDVGMLNLVERATESVTIFRASAETYDDLTSPQAFDRALDDGSVVQADQVVSEETVVVGIEASGVFGAIAAAGDDATRTTPDGLLSLLGDEALRLMVAQLSETHVGKRLDVEASLESDDARVLFDGEGGRLLLVFDSGAADFGTDDQGNRVSPAAGEEYAARFQVVNLADLAADVEPHQAFFEFVEATASFEGLSDGVLRVEQRSDATVTGTTNLAPGRAVDVRFQGSGNNPFLLTKTVEVGADGSWSAVFDLSDHPVDTSFSAEVRSEGESISEETKGVIVPSG